MEKHEEFKIVDKRKLPLMFDTKLAFKRNLGYVELGFLVWLMSCEHEGIIEEVFEKYYGIDEKFTNRVDKLKEQGYLTFDGGVIQ